MTRFTGIDGMIWDWAAAPRECTARDQSDRLAAKFGDTELTGVEIDMKVVIDQMREQVQIVE